MTTSDKKEGKKMRLKVLLLVSIMAASMSCSSRPNQIPEGTWNYDLLVNGVKAGSAVFSNTLSGGSYTLKSEMYLKMGTIENKSVQIITETVDFKPLSLEVLNTVTDTSGSGSQKISKTAVFKGDEVTLKTDDYESKFKIKDPFVLDGNFFFSELLKNRFKPGIIIKGYIYEPAVEIDAPILVIVEALGTDEVNVGEKTMKLIHIKQRVEKLKSMDMYLNESGVTEKVVIKMLNNVFELDRVE